MKKLFILLATAALPFLLVWAGFILTGFNFNPHNVFSEGAFWGLSCIYWFLWICLCPLIIEGINEVHAHNEKIRKQQAIKKHMLQYPSHMDIEWAETELNKTLIRKS
jgi:hypothetical protein